MSSRGEWAAVSVVVPTRNESGNVGPLVRRIAEAARGLVVEIIFVDDSDDYTPSVIRRVAEDSELPVRLLHRDSAHRAGGLGSAVMMGINAASSDWVLVMDGDLQHPPEMIPQIIAAATGDVRVVVASRLIGEDGVANWSPLRRLASVVCMRGAKYMFRRQLAGITDPLTGFFLVDRRALPEGLEPDGFKILLEILVRGRNLNPVEIGFTFGDRVSGSSKASLQEGVRFVKLLARLRFSNRPTSTPTGSGRKLKFRYDIHGIITIASEARLPELEWFRIHKEIEFPDIMVRVGRTARKSAPGMEFKELFGWAGFAVQISHGDRVEIVVSRLVSWSQHVLYTNVVEAVLRWEFARRGYALVHAACIVDEGSAYLITARTDTGKTTTSLKLLESGDFEFLSDDLSLVTPRGDLLTYPKPMTMSYHTVQAVNPDALTFAERVALQPQSRLHSRSGRRIGLGLANSSFPAATANAIVQFLIPPPKYPVSRILPGTQTANSAIPTHLFVIARGPDSKRGLTGEESAEIVLANCEDAYGFPPYHKIEDYMLRRSDEDLRARESATILKAFVNCPATLLQSPDYGWADAIRREIEDAATRRRAEEESSAETDGEMIVIDLTDRAMRKASEEAGVIEEGGAVEVPG